MSVTTNNPKTVAPPDGQFSQCATVEAGTKLLFISGQVSRNQVGETVGVDDMTVQAEQVFQNLAAILHEYNATFAQVIKVTLFLTDIKRVDEVMAVRKKFYGDAAPASTLVAVAALGDPDWLLEIEMVAAL
ncbi:MAG: RidA family protein [Trueperaceae bacterium]